MLKKLKLALKILPFPLVLKALFIFFLLFWLSAAPSKFYPLLFFVFFAVFFYFFPLTNALDFLGYFLIFLFGVFIVLFSLKFSPLTIIINFGLATIYFLLIGSKNLNINRQSSVFLLRTLLFLLVFFVFFLVNKSELFLIKYLLFVAAIFLLFFGLFKNYPKKKLYTVAFLFLLAQISWVINLLPIGFINQTALALVFVLIIEELAFLHFNGAFNYQNIRENIIIVIILTALILALSKWTR